MMPCPLFFLAGKNIMTRDELMRQAEENVFKMFDQQGYSTDEIPKEEYKEMVRDEFARLEMFERTRYG